VVADEGCAMLGDKGQRAPHRGLDGVYTAAVPCRHRQAKAVGTIECGVRGEGQVRPALSVFGP
jgi:hypothetical protein